MRLRDFGRRWRLVAVSCFDIVSSYLLTVPRSVGYEGRCLAASGPGARFRGELVAERSKRMEPTTRVELVTCRLRNALRRPGYTGTRVNSGLTRGRSGSFGRTWQQNAGQNTGQDYATLTKSRLALLRVEKGLGDLVDRAFIEPDAAPRLLARTARRTNDGRCSLSGGASARVPTRRDAGPVRV